MSDFITLSCPSCGGKLEITKDVEQFACAHCGNEHVVRRGAGIVSLAPVMEGLQKVQASSDRVRAELAIQRLTAELAEVQHQREAAEARRKMALQRERQASGGGVWAACAIFALFAFLGCGLLTLVAYSYKTDPGILLGFTTLSGLVAVATWGIAGLRERTKTQLRQAREAVEREIEECGRTIDRLTQERDQQRALVN
jgi:hypothetical protein